MTVVWRTKCKFLLPVLLSLRLRHRFLSAFRGVYLNAGGLRWSPPRKGSLRALCACHGEKQLREGTYCVLTHTRLSVTVIAIFLQ